MSLRYAVEKRMYPRVEAAAAAFVCSSQKFVGAYLVENISAGGALLVGSEALAAEKEILILLQLPGHQHLNLWGEITHFGRRDENEYSFGISFVKVSPKMAESIRHVMLSFLETKELPHCVLIADSNKDSRRALESELLAFGRRAVFAVDTMEVVVKLREPFARFEAVFVDLGIGPTGGLKVLEFLEMEYPNVRRILMSNPLRNCQPNLALAGGRAHAILGKPLVHGQLANILSP